MPEVDERISRFLNEKIPPVASQTHITIVHLIATLFRILLRVLPALAASSGQWASGWQRRLDSLSEYTLSAVSPLHQEIADHLRDAYDGQLEAGRTPEEAWDYVTGHFGDCEVILDELETLHYVPVWEWVSRLLAFPLVLILFSTLGRSYVGLHSGFFVNPIIGLLVFVAAPLAACNPRNWGRPVWTRWLTWGAALTLMLLSSRALGQQWQHISIVSLCVVLAVVYFRPFNSPRFITRLHAFILVTLLGMLAMGMTVVLTNLNDPSKLGGSIATVLVCLVYAVLFGQPKWKVLAMFSLLCPAILLKVGIMFASKPFLIHEPLLTANFFAKPLACVLIALLALWAVYDYRRYDHWLPAAGVLAMVAMLISGFSNLNDPTLFFNRLLSSLLPLLLWLAPVASVIWARSHKT